MGQALDWVVSAFVLDIKWRRDPSWIVNEGKTAVDKRGKKMGKEWRVRESKKIRKRGDRLNASLLYNFGLGPRFKAIACARR